MSKGIGVPAASWPSWLLLGILVLSCKPTSERPPAADGSWQPLSAAPSEVSAAIARGLRATGSGERSASCPRGGEPGHWSLVARHDGRWRRAFGDTLEVELVLHVVGDVQVREAGYTSYFVAPRVAVDTARMLAVPAADQRWLFKCRDSHSYLAFESASDSGMYVNRSDFSRVARSADSVSGAMQ